MLVANFSVIKYALSSINGNKYDIKVALRNL